MSDVRHSPFTGTTYPTRPLNPPKAILAPPMNPISRTAQQLGMANKAITANAFKRQNANDYTLANTDDVLKRFGSIGIATLATMGAAARILGVSEFIGFASWFGAMALTPKIINAMVQLKTGVNPGWEYISSEGQRKRLLNDPQYLPLSVLSDEKINQVADKLNIEPGPNRRDKVEKKIQQIAAQVNTWWMLVAGPATPVLSGLICDSLIDPASGLMNKVNVWLKERGVGEGGKASEKAVKGYVEAVAGNTTNSSLSRWWRGFGDGLVRKSGLAKAIGPMDAFPAAREGWLGRTFRELLGKPARPHSHDELTRRLVVYFEGLQDNPEQLQKFKEFLSQEVEQLAQWEKSLGDVMKANAGKVDDAFVRDIEHRFMSAKNTVKRFVDLTDALERGGLKAEEITTRLGKMTIFSINDMDQRGLVGTLKTLLDFEPMKRIQMKMWGGQYATAIKELGAPPEGFLKVALQNHMSRRLWRTRILGLLGGGLLAATALFTMFAVGRHFKGQDKSESHREGPPWLTPSTQELIQRYRAMQQEQMQRMGYVPQGGTGQWA